MNSKAEFFRLAGSTVVIEYKDRSIITSIKIIEFGEKTTKFILLNGDEVTIDNNQKLTRSSKYYCIYTVRISVNFVGLIFRQCMIIVANVII